MLAACHRCVWLGLLAFTSGCAMCGSCDDDTYAAYGGAWERLDRCYGRVGSAFTPEVGARVGTQVLPADAQPLEKPPAAEELPQAQPQPETEQQQPQMEAAPETQNDAAAESAPQPPEDEESKQTDSSVLLGPIRKVR